MGNRIEPGTPLPWDRVGSTIFALDKTSTCNRFSMAPQGGFVERQQGWSAAERTSDEELLANAEYAHHAANTHPLLVEALERCLNFITNTENELGVTLESGDLARQALASAQVQS